MPTRSIFISADIEGCAGVASQQALGPGEWEWQAAREWMTGEVAAACEAVLSAGYDEVIVADGHGNAQNLMPERLPPRTRLVRSWPRPLLQMEGVQEPSVEGCFFIGFHNGVQGHGGILAHTYHGGAIRDLRVNGESASEGYFNAALAGELGKPVLLVTGDDAACGDAARYAPQAVTCPVKTAIGWRAQTAMTPVEACEAIGSAAAAALDGGSGHTPFVIPAPVEIEVEMTTRVAAEMLGYLRAVEPVGPYTIRTVCESMREAMQFVSFLILYSPTGKIAL